MYVDVVYIIFKNTHYKQIMGHLMGLSFSLIMKKFSTDDIIEDILKTLPFDLEFITKSVDNILDINNFQEFFNRPSYQIHYFNGK